MDWQTTFNDLFSLFWNAYIAVQTRPAPAPQPLEDKGVNGQQQHAPKDSQSGKSNQDEQSPKRRAIVRRFSSKLSAMIGLQP
jgi:hypothetical protein